MKQGTILILIIIATLAVCYCKCTKGENYGHIKSLARLPITDCLQRCEDRASNKIGEVSSGRMESCRTTCHMQNY